MNAYIILVNDKIFKAFLKQEQAEEYYNLLQQFTSRKIIRKLFNNRSSIELICIPIEEDADFTMALGNMAHAGAGSSAKYYDLEPFSLSL